MTEVELKITGEIQKVVVQPDDVVVVNIDGDCDYIDSKMAEEIKERVQNYFPNNKVMVCGPHIRVGVMKEVK